jgi:hypothetical protein
MWSSTANRFQIPIRRPDDKYREAPPKCRSHCSAELVGGRRHISVSLEATPGLMDLV